MNHPTKHFLPRLFIFWIALFTLARIAFITFLFFTQPHETLNGWSGSFLHGIPLDLSTAAYLTALPALLYTVAVSMQNRRIVAIIQPLNVLLLFLILLILFSNLIVYKAWGTMINARVISFLRDPEGIIASVTTFQLIALVTTLALLFIAGLYFYRRWCNLILPEAGKSVITQNIVFLLLIPIFIRGGFGEIPINESASFYSTSMPLNHAATNPAWYLINNLAKSGINKENPYRFFDEQQLLELTRDISRHEPETISIISHKKPNIVLIVLESWSADLIAPLGGIENTTPFFNQLCNDGYLFTQIYSSGRRTDQMLPSVLSGFPAQPNHSISRFSNKLHALPMLPKVLEKEGYVNSFIYGGELEFANMRAFLTEAGFRTITGEDAFAKEEMNSKWGAHDEFIFKKALSESRQDTTPFFQMILTLSTHEPFEVPGVSSSARTEQDKFLQAAAYTDRCLRNYFEAARKTAWYANTLFILVADHGHAVPKGRNYYDPQCFHIPLLFTGPVLDTLFAGRTNDTFGSQHEIANALLSQLGIEDTAFRFGSSLTLQNRNQPVYLNYDDGIGVISKTQSYVYLFGEKKELTPYTRLSSPHDSLMANKGKAFLQKLYGQFLAY